MTDLTQMLIERILRLERRLASLERMEYTVGGSTPSSLTVKEEDGSPSVSSVTEIQVTNGTLTNDSTGVVSLAYAPSTQGVTNGNSHDHAGGDGAQVDHGGLGGLSDDDHTNYVHISTARTITAQHSFSPGTATAPFTLGANAQGQLVTGLNADKLDGSEATAFAVAAKGVTNGDSHDHAGGDGAQIDHGGLGGLSDDDHTGYLLANGTRSLSGDLTFTGGLKSYKNSTSYAVYGLRLLSSVLTSTSWDGDSFSSTSKTLIDLSAVFGAPAGIFAALCQVSIRDSGAGSTDCYLQLAADNDTYTGTYFYCFPANDRWVNYVYLVPCDANGDIYYSITASGSSTFDAYLQIVGYLI